MSRPSSIPVSFAARLTNTNTTWSVITTSSAGSIPSSSAPFVLIEPDTRTAWRNTCWRGINKHSWSNTRYTVVINRFSRHLPISKWVFTRKGLIYSMLIPISRKIFNLIDVDCGERYGWGNIKNCKYMIAANCSLDQAFVLSVIYCLLICEQLYNFYSYVYIIIIL